MHVRELLDEEVTALAVVRHVSNPGSVRLAGQRVPVRVPRVRGAQGEMALRSYGALQGSWGSR